MIVMQMSFQPLNGAARRKRLCAAATLFALGFMAELRAESFSTDWIAGKKSAARLIAAPGAAKGAYRAAVEIRLDSDALTYWRTPGEAGAPPVFNFQGSENLKGVKVRYPTPQRIDEAGLDAFGYRDAVTFPVDVELADESHPGVLSLSLDYAVCAKICMPVRAKAKLELPARPVAAASPDDAAFEAASAKVPRRLTAAERDAKIAISRDRAAVQPTWHVSVRPEPEGGPVAADRARPDLFVEAPEGWYFESKKGDQPNEFLVVQLASPDGGVDATGGGSPLTIGPIPVTLTLAQPGQSFEFGVDLNAVPTVP
jgi:DsbC/DsbD-like thiol-disulfide interchange protein